MTATCWRHDSKPEKAESSGNCGKVKRELDLSYRISETAIGIPNDGPSPSRWKVRHVFSRKPDQVKRKHLKILTLGVPARSPYKEANI